MTASSGNSLNTPSPPPLARGYSVLPPTGKATVQGASTTFNVLIKKRLPARGVVSSNPKRVERFLERATAAGMISEIKEHTNVGWGVEIYTCRYRSIELFVAGVPMGSAGSGFAFFEMYAAGAQAIIRYGSNDRQVTMEDLQDIVVVDRADNLTGLAHGSGQEHVTPDTILSASDDLVDLLLETIQEHELDSRRMICHNVEDYHAYNFGHLFVSHDAIGQQIQHLEQDAARHANHRTDCWDMETAALFWRAQQFGTHAATVLQNLIKQPGTSPYEGAHGKISLEMEPIFYQVLLDTLYHFTPQLEQKDAPPSPPHARALRSLASNDWIGTDEPLLLLTYQGPIREEEEDNADEKKSNEESGEE